MKRSCSRSKRSYHSPRRYLCVVVLIACGLFFGLIDRAGAQGISRSWGLGTRLSFWRSNQPEGESGEDLFLDVDGAGASLFFFTRIYERLFLEGQIGAVGKLTKADPNPLVQDVDLAAVIPILLGLRFDLLPRRAASVFQPFIEGGFGPYWAINVKSVGSDDAKVSSDLEFGPYVGGGANVLLINWFALHYDIRYHFVTSDRTSELGGYEFNAGFCFMWGRRREMYRVEDIRVVTKDIYPAYYQFYNTYPLALVTVRNTNRYPIEINVRSRVQGYSERRQESGFVIIEPRETKDIPVHALFGPRLLKNSRREPAIIDIELIGRAGGTQKSSHSAQVIIHNRNAWNGDVDKLGFFVTPDDEEIMMLGREAVRGIADFDARADRFFLAGQTLFEKLREMSVRYRSDPNIPYYQDDRVQFASETTLLRTGDCDDLVVMYASLLGSLGVHTAFVDVQDPGKPLAHVYLMFDTGISPEQGAVISTNEKRYVIRETRSGGRSIWIPVEVTLIEEGFEEAWHAGALQYLQEGILRNGLSEGWVRVIDVE